MHNDDGSAYIELPYTLKQDSTLFLVLREAGNDIWKRKLDWVAAGGGMALLGDRTSTRLFALRRSLRTAGRAASRPGGTLHGTRTGRRRAPLALDRDPGADAGLLEGGASPGLRTRIDDCETPLDMATAAGLDAIAALLTRHAR